VKQIARHAIRANARVGEKSSLKKIRSWPAANKTAETVQTVRAIYIPTV